MGFTAFWSALIKVLSHKYKELWWHLYLPNNFIQSNNNTNVWNKIDTELYHFIVYNVYCQWRTSKRINNKYSLFHCRLMYRIYKKCNIYRNLSSSLLTFVVQMLWVLISFETELLPKFHWKMSFVLIYHFLLYCDSFFIMLNSNIESQFLVIFAIVIRSYYS